MNRSFQRLMLRAFILIIAVSLASLTSCDTGTQPGNTNVEYGKPKDKNPTKHNDNGRNEEPDTTANTNK